jgi:hypothetical protein
MSDTADDARLSSLLAEYAEAKAEAARWHRRCAAWTEAFGLKIWREGHPLDQEKLYWRRTWRHRCRILARLILEQPAGSA